MLEFRPPTPKLADLPNVDAQDNYCTYVEDVDSVYIFKGAWYILAVDSHWENLDVPSPVFSNKTIGI